jgi:hypothetical protein
MPINLHPDCRARLQEALTEALPALTIENGMFPDRRSIGPLLIADLALPQTEKVHDQLISYLDEFPLTEFILDTLGQELWELDKYQSGANPKLTEIEGYHDVERQAGRLLVQFVSLPWHYQITVPLPEALAELLRSEETDVGLSPSIRIVRATEEFSKQFPLETSSDRLNQRLAGGVSMISLLANDKPKWVYGALYLQIAAEGFIGQHGGSATAGTAELQLRSLFGMGLATRLIDSQYTFFPSPPKSFAYVHRQTGDATWQATARYNLDDAVSRGIANLKLHDLEGRLRPEHKPAWVSVQLNDIGVAFRSGGRAEQTILAAQWLFDSYSGQDPLLSFVQSMVVLEIILGDKSASDEIGIGELISNRFAYLIGTTHDERTDLIRAFKKIYQVRSQIVHSGKPKLSLSERTLFSQLRWMCRRAIAKEIELLKAGMNKELLANKK